MRPKVLHVGGILYWVIRTRNPDTQVLKDADSTPTVAVRKNGASVGDSVTVTKRSATTGIYDCSYNPAGEIEGDKFTIEESATVTGTTTSSATYENSWEVTVIAVERGTDGANTTTPPTASANATAVRSELTTELGRIDVAVSSRLASASYTAPDNTSITAIKTKTDNLPSDPADASDITAAFTEIKGTGWSSTTDTLEKIAESSGGAGNSIIVTPVVAQTPVRVVGSNIETFIGDLSDIRVGVFSGTDPVDLSTMGDLEACVQLKSGVDLDVVSMADITIDGDDNNYFSWTPNGESVDAVRTGKWSLRKASNKQVIAYGAWIVVDAALSDAS